MKFSFRKGKWVVGFKFWQLECEIEKVDGYYYISLENNDKNLVMRTDDLEYTFRKLNEAYEKRYIGRV